LLDLEKSEVRADRAQRGLMRAQLRIGDQHVNPRVPENVIHLVRFEKIVDRDHHRACLEDTEQSGNKFRAIF
jgi:hypothetical protein